ncbi:hypothetical protein D3C73_1166870 [compost metagenome]
MVKPTPNPPESETNTSQREVIMLADLAVNRALDNVAPTGLNTEPLWMSDCSDVWLSPMHQALSSILINSSGHTVSRVSRSSATDHHLWSAITRTS